MKSLKNLFSIAAVGMLIAAGPAFAQTPPPQNPPAQPPAGTQPPATQPPVAAQPPATPPAGAQKPATPPKPFPEGAKVGYIDVQAVASTSIEGKAATARIQEWDKKKTAELQTKNKQAQDLQTKLQQGGNVLSEQARSQSEKELQKLQRELQGMQEDAQAERQEMTEKLQLEFQEKLNPVIDAIATEKNLHVVLDARNSGVVWAYSGVDISAEVIKRFDAAVKTAPKK